MSCPVCRYSPGCNAYDPIGIYQCNVRLAMERDLMLANLTAVQARCTELLEEVRRLKAELRDADECAAPELTS